MYNRHMETRKFTDIEYIPEANLKIISLDMYEQEINYRKQFIDIIAIDDFTFIKIVETPFLIKKRFEMNTDIKGIVQMDFESNDYILEIAKNIVLNKPIEGLLLSDKTKLLDQYSSNGNDLTIITTYLVKNIFKMLVASSAQDLDNLYPELSNFDKLFIRTNNQITLSYKISDYQKINYCSYETARKSLDKLASLNLYKKSKIGKKFVYQPTDKLINIL